MPDSLQESDAYLDHFLEDHQLSRTHPSPDLLSIIRASIDSVTDQYPRRRTAKPQPFAHNLSVTIPSKPKHQGDWQRDESSTWPTEEIDLLSVRTINMVLRRDEWSARALFGGTSSVDLTKVKKVQSGSAA